MNIKTAYNQWAHNYDTTKNLTRDLDREITQKNLKNMDVATLLELGSGTGKNTPYYAEISQKVTCLEFSEEMINQAKSKLFPGMEKKICIIKCDLINPWPLETEKFDLVTANLLLEHIRDLKHVFSQAHRVLVKNGLLYISEYHPFRHYLEKGPRFMHENKEMNLTAYTHHISEYTNTASTHGFCLVDLQEWWHKDDKEKPPRLLTIILKKPDA